MLAAVEAAVAPTDRTVRPSKRVDLPGIPCPAKYEPTADTAPASSRRASSSLATSAPFTNSHPSLPKAMILMWLLPEGLVSM